MQLGQIIDGYLQTTEVEEARVERFVSAGWKQVEAIDPSKLACEEGYVVRIVPYDDGDKIAYRYETVFDVQHLRRNIEAQKEALTASDYKVIKCYEASLLGQPLPYDIEGLHVERQACRDKINELETTMINLTNNVAD